MNITRPIWRNANAHPERVALIFDGAPTTYMQLARGIGIASGRLANAGIVCGDVVALAQGNPVAFVILALAAARLGAVGNPFNAGWSDTQKNDILARHRTRALVGDPGATWRSAEMDLLHLSAPELLAPVSSVRDVPKIPLAAQDVDDQPWLIFMSSGTTGVPKSIVQTHRRALLTANMRAGVAGFEQGRVMVFINHFVHLCMQTVIRQLMGGGTVVLTSRRKPEDFFQAVQRDRPDRVMTTTGTATLLVAHAARSLPDSRALCHSVRSLAVGGSAVTPAVREGIEKHLCPYMEINYGSTEGAGLVQSRPEDRAAQPLTAGRPYPWVEMQVVDENDRPLPAGMSGELRFRSPLVCDGYLNDPAATARHFKNGWYYPGDTGVVDEAGYLTLNGRTDELINLGGNKVDPFIVEALLDSQPGITESAALAVNNSTGLVVMVALVVSDAAVDEEALRQICRERLGAKNVPSRILRTDALIRNEGGKIDRHALASRLKSTPT